MDFRKKVAFVALVVIALLILHETISVLLMVLAATIVTLYFYGIAGRIEQITRLSSKWSLALSFVLTFLIIGALFWLVGAKISEQFNQMVEKLPTFIDQAKSKIEDFPWGKRILNRISSTDSEKYMSTVKKFFGSTFGVLGDIYVILFLTIFILAEPSTYRKGIIALVPKDHKDRAAEILDLIRIKLLGWLKGKLIAMAVIGIFTAIGLLILGVPMALALAVIAAVLSFVPNFGPVVSLIPAFLIGLTQGTTTALIIVALYIFIQVIESNLITPLVQRKLVHIPPALIITGQLVIGGVTGYLGVIFATPVVLIIMVLVKELYTKKQQS